VGLNAKQGDAVIKRAVTVIILALCVGLFIIAYAGEDEKKDVSSSENAPESYTLGHLTKTYEPVTFSHGMHALLAEDCVACHHHSQPGQTPSCNECHGTSSELKDKYHHLCIDCHKEMKIGPIGCTECHAKKITQKAPIKTRSKEGPEVLTLNTLENIYEAVTFSHQMHTLVTEDCVTCHHHSQPGQTSSCKECHGAPSDPKNLNMPGLKGAYHLQCMGCHQEMNGGPTDCTECHAKKVRQETAIKEK